MLQLSQFFLEPKIHKLTTAQTAGWPLTDLPGPIARERHRDGDMSR